MTLSKTDGPAINVDPDDGTLILYVPLDGNPDDGWCRLFQTLPSQSQLSDGVIVAEAVGAVRADTTSMASIDLKPDTSEATVERVLDWLVEALEQANRLRAESEDDEGRILTVVERWWRDDADRSV